MVENSSHKFLEITEILENTERKWILLISNYTIDLFSDQNWSGFVFYFKIFRLETNSFLQFDLKIDFFLNILLADPGSLLVEFYSPILYVAIHKNEQAVLKEKSRLTLREARKWPFRRNLLYCWKVEDLEKFQNNRSTNVIRLRRKKTADVCSRSEFRN